MIESVPGQGTRVMIQLPANKRLHHDHGNKDEGLEGTGRILMVDDEDMILSMGETILSSYGYEVITASCGEEALRKFDELGATTIDLVITDMVMPQMGGRELIERLRSRKPDQKILSSTGYVRSSQGNSQENYLLKPFTSQDLLRKVKSLIRI